jgi:hypothetical protein
VLVLLLTAHQQIAVVVPNAVGVVCATAQLGLIARYPVSKANSSPHAGEQAGSSLLEAELV